MTTKTVTTVDATGLICPMPLLKLKEAMAALRVGEVVEIWVTDPHAELDFEIWCERFGHGLTGVVTNEAKMVFQVKHGK